MSGAGVQRAPSAGAAPGLVHGQLHGQYNDIAEALALPPQRQVLSTDLEPWQQAASLPAAAPAADALQPLTRFLGAALTVANPAWSRDPLPGMRGLQKSLVAYSLTLPQAERADSMAAIGVVERAVRLRLRWQQMELGPQDADAGAEGA